MRNLLFVVSLIFICLPSYGQEVNPDSIQAFINEDKNCGDFDGMLDAQSHYRALQIILNDPTADPHGLDRDGNGYACEGLEFVREINYSENFWVRTVEVLHSVQCSQWTDVIEVREFSQQMENAPFEQQVYLPTIDEAECLDTLYEIYQSQ